jgi:hypothetical protein
MASLGDAGGSAAVEVGAGELDSATATLLAGARFTVVAVDRTPNALDELPGGDTTGARPSLSGSPSEAGPPEVLVNTIGGLLLDEAVKATPENLPVVVDVSPGAALWLSQAVEPYMWQRCSSTSVRVPGTDPTAGMARPDSASRPSATASGSSTVSCARTVSGPRNFLTPPETGRVIPAEVLAHAVRPEAAANIIPFLVATAPHSSAVRPCQPTAPSPATSHPATPPHLTRS